MVIYTEQLANIAKSKQTIESAQQQVAARRASLSTQQALRSGGGLQAMQQRQRSYAELEKQSQTLGSAQQSISTQQQQIETAQKDYQQQQQAEADRQQRIQQTIEQLKGYTGSGYVVYNAAVGSLIEGLARDTGMSVQEAKSYYTSLAESSPAYRQAASDTGVRMWQEGVRQEYTGTGVTPWFKGGEVIGTSTMTMTTQPTAPPLVVSAAPTLKQQYLSYVGGQPIKGTVSFIAEKAKGLWTKSQIWGMRKGLSTPEQMDTSAKVIGGATQLGTYAIPYVGAGLLAAGGVESYVTPQGREQLKQLQTSWASSGVPNVLSYSAYAIPAAEIGLGFVGLKSEIGTTQIVREVNPRGVKNIAFDVIRPVETKVGNLEVGGFELQSYQPARVYVKTTKFRELFGMKPLDVVVTKPKLFGAGTSDVVGIITREGKIINEPIVTSSRAGSNLVKLYKISGESKTLTMSEFAKLPKEQKFLFQKLAEVKTGGIPVSVENVPRVLGENFEYATGGVRYDYLGRINTKTGRFLLPKEGKTITISESITAAKNIPQEEFFLPKQVEDMRIYKTLTKTKDVTKPFSRASGTPTEIEGTTFVFPTRTQGTIGKVSESGTITLTKTKPVISEQSLKFMGNVKEAALKTFPKPTTPRIKIDKIKEIPVSGIGIISTIPKQRETLNVANVIFKQENKVIQKPKTNLEIKTIPSSIEVVKTTTIPKVENIELTKTSQGISQIQIQKQQLKLDTTQKLELKTGQQYRTTQLFKEINQPRIKPTIPPISKAMPKKPSQLNRIIDKLKSKAYSVEVKRRGKFTEIGKALPIGKARQLGVAVASKTLARTFRLIEKGTTEAQDISYRVSGRLFRPPKKPIGKESYVQIKALTRGTGEVPEIQAARRSKSRRIKFL